MIWKSKNIIDSMIEKDVREKVSAGQIVKAIIGT